MDKLKWHEYLIAFIIVFGISQVFFTGNISFNNLFCNETCQREKRESREEWRKYRADKERAEKALRGLQTINSFTDPYTNKTDWKGLEEFMKADPYNNSNY